MQIFLFFALFISVLAVVFAVQNNSPVTVAFATLNYSGSLALVLLVTLLVGALISFFFSLPGNIKIRWGLRQQRKKISELELKIEDLKNKLEVKAREEQTALAAQPPSNIPTAEPAPYTPVQTPLPIAPAVPVVLDDETEDETDDETEPPAPPVPDL